MAGNQTPKGEAVVQYLKRHPKMPLLTLARLMHKEQPKMFPDIENTRKLIQKYVSANRHVNLGDRYGVKREKGASGADAWQDMMPESLQEPHNPFILPKSVRKALVLSDIHAPYHDVPALTLAIDHGLKAGVDAVILNGDILDFYAMSDHEKDPRKIDWLGELEAGRGIFRMIRAAFPNMPIYFVTGNHSYRLERHLMKYAPILLGMHEFELPTLFGFGELAITHIENKRVIHAGKLTIGHGDNWKGGGGVNPARWLSLRTGEPTLIGHFHRTSSHIERTVRNSIRGWWSTGCLCELNPTYLPMNQWSHGFAIVEIDKDGTFEVDNLSIIEGKVR